MASRLDGHRRQARGARHVEEQHASGQQRQATRARDDQRLQRRRPRVARSCSKPISRKDVKPVSSQNTNSVRMLSLSATPSIAPMKAKSDA